MKIIKKYISIFILLFIFLLNVNFSSVKAEEKIYVDVSVSQTFLLDSVCVLMKHEVSMKEKTYIPSDFIEVQPDKVVDDDPYTYEEILKYLKGKPYNTNINVNNFRRGLTLKWNNSKTKEEIVEIVHILEEREDIYLVQPNYCYVLDSSGLDEKIDVVPNDIWQSIYYVKVTNKDDQHYLLRGKRQYVIEAEIIKSYDELVQVESNIDKLIKSTKENNKFKFVVNTNMFDEFNIGYEYIVKLTDIITLDDDLNNVSIKLPQIKDKTYNYEFIPVINNRLFTYTIMSTEIKSGNDINNKRYLDGCYFFSIELSKYLFQKEYVKNEGPVEFEVEYITDPAGNFTHIVISDEERQKLEYGESMNDMLMHYRFYYYKTGIFLQTGDNVLMFNEYIKLAKEIYDGKELYNPTYAGELRSISINNIKK